jgi:transposase
MAERANDYSDYAEQVEEDLTKDTGESEIHNKRLFPIAESTFNEIVLPIIEDNYIWKGRPPIISHYMVFSAILYILRTGTPWRDLPKIYGHWHTIYTRFARGSERGLWWKIVKVLQKQKDLTLDIVLCDSSTFELHRHGGGLKKRNTDKGQRCSWYNN